LSHCTSNVEDHARLDIFAKGFWNNTYDQAFVDARVFNPLAKSHFNHCLSNSYRMNENKEKRTYNEILNMVHLNHSFSLLLEALDQLPHVLTNDWLLSVIR